MSLNFNELSEIAKIVFNTPTGKTLLSHLDEKFYDNKFKDEDLNRQVGRRDVLVEIHNLLRDREK